MTDCENRPLLFKTYRNNNLQMRRILTQVQGSYYSKDMTVELEKTEYYWYLRYYGRVLYKVYSQAPKPELITEMG